MVEITSVDLVDTIISKCSRERGDYADIDGIMDWARDYYGLGILEFGRTEAQQAVRSLLRSKRIKRFEDGWRSVR